MTTEQLINHLEDRITRMEASVERSVAMYQRYSTENNAVGAAYSNGCAAGKRQAMDELRSVVQLIMACEEL